MAFISVKAQNPLSLYYLENIPQTSTINPAKTPRANAFFGVPVANSVYLRMNTDLFGPDLIQNSNGRYFTLLDSEFDYNLIYNRIGNEIDFSSNQSVSPLFMGFSGKKGYFTFAWTEKFTETINLPKDLLSAFPDRGFPVNTTIDFSSLALKAQYYRELSFGYSYNFMDKLRIGVHAKLLQGLAAIKTDIETMNIDLSYIDENNTHMKYDFEMDGNVYISGPISFETFDNGSISKPVMPSMDMGSIMNSFVFNFKNPGIAFDLGANYEYNDAWTFSGSVNDLGFINWNGDLSTINLSSEFSFEGLKIEGLDPENSNDAVAGLVDSIKEKSNTNLKHLSFSSGLGPKVYLGAQYNVNHYFSAGGLSRTMFIKNNFTQEFNLSANLNLYRVLTTTLNYTLSTKGTSTIGFGFALRGGPLQMYLLADYIPVTYRSLEIQSDNKSPMKIPIVPYKMDNFNLMFGLNILIGPNGFRNTPMIDAYNEY